MKHLLTITIIGASLTIGNVCAMDRDPDWGKRGWALQKQEVEFRNIPPHLRGKSQDELRAIVGQALDATSLEGEKATVDMSKIPGLMQTSLTKKVLTHGVAFTLGLGLGFLLVKKMNAPE